MDTNQSTHFRIAALTTGHLKGVLNPEEQAELNEWLAESKEHQHLFQELIDPATEQEYVRGMAKYEEEVALERFLLKQKRSGVATHRIHFLKTTWFRYAAAIIIMVTGTVIWYTQYNHSKSFNPLNHSSRQIATIAPSHDKAILTLANGQQITLDSTQGNIVKQGNLSVVNLAGQLKYEGMGATTEYNTLSTPKGGQYQIVLPDGSKVWLNAASSIKFPTAFASSDRQVEMTGEAYMEIAKNPKQSFIVKVNGVEIQVLGTSFNVNAYVDETALKTTLLEGSVRLIKDNRQQLLRPGEQGIVANNGITVNQVRVDEIVAWKNGLFNFNGADLPNLMRQLERWYDIQVKYKGKIKDRTFWGKLPRSFKLSDVIESLEDMNIHCSMEGRTLIVQ